MKFTLLPLAAFLSFNVAVAESAPAVSETLLCTVTAIYTSNDDGSMNQITARSEQSPLRQMIGSQFMIDRSTGATIGKFHSNKGLNVSVLEYGDDQQSYKAIERNTTGYLFVSYMVIDIYARGPRKPFRYSDTNSIDTGFCQ
jgi:hypothetical protein